MTLVLGFAAVNTGNNLVYLMASAMLGFMAVSGIIGKWNLSKVRVDLIPPDEVYDSIPTLYNVTLSNHRAWLPACLIDVVIGDRNVLFPIVDAGKTKHRNMDIVFQGRGSQKFSQVTIRSRFPINFFVRSMPVAIDRDIVVFPQPLSCVYQDQNSLGDMRGSESLWDKGYDGDVVGISDYHGGDPLKFIHWKLSARHDGLKVKEFSSPAHMPVTLNLDNIQAKGIEQMLSFATYLVINLLRSGRPVGLKAGSVTVPPKNSYHQKLKLLKILALYGFTYQDHT